MTEDQGDALIEILTKQHQLLESIDWKLWEIYKQLTGTKEDKEDKED
jgi:hypothetical protein